jgi:hypothetical protein
MITIRYNGRSYQYKVERVEVTDKEERYKVFTRSDTILFISNRPFFLKKKLKHRAINPTWKVEEGKIKSNSLKEAFIIALNAHLNKPG